MFGFLPNDLPTGASSGSTKKGNRHDVEVFAQLPLSSLGAILRLNPPCKGVSGQTTSHWHDFGFLPNDLGMQPRLNPEQYEHGC